MTTEEILKLATQRPWHVGNIAGGCASVLVSTLAGDEVVAADIDRVDAELIVRAVNEFERLRLALAETLVEMNNVSDELATQAIASEAVRPALGACLRSLTFQLERMAKKAKSILVQSK